MKSAIAIILLSGLGLSSCKKAYQCDCTKSPSVTYKEWKRADAITDCKQKAKTSIGEECAIVN